MPRRPLIAGNWKMNAPANPIAEIRRLAAVSPAIDGAEPALLICPPFTLIPVLAGRGVRIGAQDCHAAGGGAHTGDVSAEMLAAAGATHVILGHSERRGDHGETDADVAAKVAAAWAADLTTIICVGETQEERAAGDAVSAVARQFNGSVPRGANSVNTIIAYEPVWAIGSGEAASQDEIAEMHAAIRRMIAARFGNETARKTRIIYGGSLKPENAEEILELEDVDGGLVGGASLSADDLIAILDAC